MPAVHQILILMAGNDKFYQIFQFPVLAVKLSPGQEGRRSASAWAKLNKKQAGFEVPHLNWGWVRVGSGLGRGWVGFEVRVGLELD